LFKEVSASGMLIGGGGVLLGDVVVPI